MKATLKIISEKLKKLKNWRGEGKSRADEILLCEYIPVRTILAFHPIGKGVLPATECSNLASSNGKGQANVNNKDNYAAD